MLRYEGASDLNSQRTPESLAPGSRPSAMLRALFACFVSIAFFLPLATAQADVSCALGQAPLPVAGSGKSLCSDGTNAFGPFPEGMRQDCRASGQPFCDAPAWPLFLAFNLRGFDVCPKGTVPEPGTPYCSDEKNLYGPFFDDLRAKCRAESGGPACDLNAYGRAFARSLLGLPTDTPPPATALPSPTQPVPVPVPEPSPRNAVGSLIAEILSRREAGSATFQDSESRGIFPGPEGDARSEKVYLPFVLGPRRQVDQMVRQLYLLLPQKIRSETAFIIPDRFVQNPEAYLPYLRSRARVVVIASFVGIGEATSRSSKDYQNSVRRHDQELWQLSKTLEAAVALGKPIASVVLGMGDSTTDFGPTVRAEIQRKVDELTSQIGVREVTTAVTWGADELVAVAFARELPDRGVKVWFSNPNARHTWDGRRTTIEIVNEKITQARLHVEDKAPDLWSIVLSRRPGQADSFDPSDRFQSEFDDSLLRDFRNMTAAEANMTSIIDGRAFNGAWNDGATLGRCDLLAYGSWGTFGNNVGQTLAAAKILRAADNPIARKQLLLESVAHDVFSIGYAEAQASTLASLLRPLGIEFNHYYGYSDASSTNAVFGQLNTLVNRRMREHYRNTACLDERTFRSTAQLWRTFESEVHIWPPQTGEVFGAGVHRTDLANDWFNPTRGEVGAFGLSEVVAEGCCGG